MKRGVVYAAGGSKIFFDQARASVRSLKERMPSIHVTIFTNRNRREGSFDNFEYLELPDWMTAKIHALRRAPYDLCVWLDSDTFVCHHLSDLFDLVEDRFDVAFTSNSGKPSRYPTEDVPKDFPECSTGVIALNRNAATMEFLDSWEATFHRHKKQYKHLRKSPNRHPSQPSFRLALYHSDLRLLMLPRREYNCPFWSGFVHEKVKILHFKGGYRKLKRFEAIVNKHPNKPRAFWHREIIRSG